MYIEDDVLLLDVLLLSDVHVDLEDDDHVDVISPLSFKVVMNNLMVSMMILKDLMLVSMMGEVS